MSILEKTATTAIVNVVYSLRVDLASGRISRDSHVSEHHEVRCAASGRWLIERNTDYVARGGARRGSRVPAPALGSLRGAGRQPRPRGRTQQAGLSDDAA